MNEASNGKCNIMNSAKNGGEITTDVFGIVALKDIREGETVFENASFMVALEAYSGYCTGCCCVLPSAKAKLLKCCKLRVCSAHWDKVASGLFHKAVCGANIVNKWQTSSKSDNSSKAAGWSLVEKVLTVGVQSKKHPLNVPIVNQLFAPTAAREITAVNFRTEIVDCFKFLQDLSVDIFTDQRLDTWVLHTITARLVNDAHAGDDRIADGLLVVHSLFSFFNHSCIPNVYWELRDDQPNTLVIRTQRNIRQGEELCIFYFVENELLSNRAEKRSKLSSWMVGDCQCQRCRINKPDVTLTEMTDFLSDTDETKMFLNAEDLKMRESSI
jgi:SET domain